MAVEEVFPRVSTLSVVVGVAVVVLVVLFHDRVYAGTRSPIQVLLDSGEAVWAVAAAGWPASIRICRLCFGLVGCHGLLSNDTSVCRRPGHRGLQLQLRRPPLRLCRPCLGLACLAWGLPLCCYCRRGLSS